MPEFQIDDYYLKKDKQHKLNNNEDFYNLCKRIKNIFYSDWEKQESSSVSLNIQKRAIIGYEKEKNFYIERIEEIINEYNANDIRFPSWYRNLSDAIYHENWGLAGMSEWFEADYSQSSSAKIVGENIFYMYNGKMKLMPQKISIVRKEQLIKAFMLNNPEERLDKSYYELYMLDGTRVTIYSEPMAKKGQSAIVFRRYIIPSLSFEEMAKRHTIPKNIIPMFKAMVSIGYNVVFTGAVRTAKTTFLSTWQSYEDPTLEGVLVETDPEIPLDKILPGAPIIQLIADGNELKSISKNLLRSDADYFIMAEARDGIALDTAIRIACKGTKRMKMTFHSRNPYHFPLEVATEIVKSTGGDINLTMQKTAANFDYIFSFIQLNNKNQKRLKGIYELKLSQEDKISVTEILLYNSETDNWTMKYHISEDKEQFGYESDSVNYEVFKSEMRKLSECGVIN